MKSFALLLASTCVLCAQSDNLLRHDRNGDGTVDRQEWRGSLRDFDRHDWNRDGVLSGDEIRGSRRDNQTRSRAEQTADRLDKNRSGVVEGYEWPYNSDVFHRLDRDADSTLSAEELRGLDSIDMPQARNRTGGYADFGQLDQDRDGRVSTEEYYERGGGWQRRQRFDKWDENRDGVLNAREWQGTRAMFRRLDANRDSAVSFEEFMANKERYNEQEGWR